MSVIIYFKDKDGSDEYIEVKVSQVKKFICKYNLEPISLLYYLPCCKSKSWAEVKEEIMDLNYKKCSKCRKLVHVHDLWYDRHTKKQVHNKCLSEKGRKKIWKMNR